MTPMYLLVLVTGDITNQRLNEVWTKSVKVFRQHKIDFFGEFLHAQGHKISVGIHAVDGSLETPTIWIIGLNPNEWFGDKLRSLLDDLTSANGTLALSASN